MTSFKLAPKVKLAESTVLSDFFKHASSARKKQVFTSVIRKSIQDQKRVLEK